ncbi:hypothetical protein OHR86_27925 [Streptomyces sp. NBC_00441]|uniref:hypothetical protein n=1 Tax=Streptomyces sp. NBC_00441 TaxID=2975742 RepID=UPI002E2C289B|nr:hypothetical protein [Streptomyces sp. NBC_00441]
MDTMSALDQEIQNAARRRADAEREFLRTDVELKELLVKGRAAGLGPSEMAKLTGFTREWVSKIAPDESKSRKGAIQRRLDKLNADSD